MQTIKIGLIRENKVPADARVPLAPHQAADLQKAYPRVKVFCQSSLVRCFTDQEYEAKGVQVVDDVQHCDVLMGIKEVPVDQLIPDKTYFFFSHTIKKQPYNQHLLQEVLRKRIKLIDYECLKNEKGQRLVAFGRYAGIVGAYNGILTYGLKYNLFSLKRANQCFDYQELRQEYSKIYLPPVKILITGTGRVGQGAREVLEGMKIKKVWPKDIIGATFDQPVFAQLFSRDYYTRKDGAKFDIHDFYRNPAAYASDFSKYIPHTDLLIVGSYWDPHSPVLFTRQQMLQEQFRIKVIADITCDIDGSVPSTQKASSIEDPIYDYNPQTNSTEAPFSNIENVSVMAIDNLPSELPRDASTDFGHDLMENVFPALLKDDPQQVINRATITSMGNLTPHFNYLEDYASVTKKSDR
ncbi:MAG: NAD(P)-dependent oxidoreductase [Candidatus Cyclobacteriaceae bacterium M3_2C_046]